MDVSSEFSEHPLVPEITRLRRDLDADEGGVPHPPWPPCRFHKHELTKNVAIDPSWSIWATLPMI